MRRQLRATGGITNARQGYGIGSWVKEKVRKIIPNELADVAVKAAPFVAPFFPGAAAAMRGIGRFDQRGSISDAMKQAGATYGFGKLAGKLGGAEGSGLLNPGRQTYSSNPLANIGKNLRPGGDGVINKILYGGDKESFLGGKGLIGAGGEATLAGSLGGGRAAVFSAGVIGSVIAQALTKVPEKGPGESMEEFNTRRKQVVGGYLKQYLGNTRKFQDLSDSDLNSLVEQYNTGYNQGGRVGYNEGTNPKKEFLIKKGYGDMVKGMSVIEIDQLFNSVKGTFTDQGTYREPGNMGGIMRAGYANGSEEFQNYLKGRQKFEKEMSLEELYKDYLRMKKDQRIAEEKTMAADGGLMRLNYMIGGEAKQMEAGAPPIMYSGNMDPNAQTGLPSIPGPMQMAEDGPEFDMRQQGGFQPLGRQEGKDDVPAMLAKNEFVMTADAVRAAGGGSIQKGAQKMYNTMKKLESRVS